MMREGKTSLAFSLRRTGVRAMLDDVTRGQFTPIRFRDVENVSRPTKRAYLLNVFVSFYLE